MKFISLSKWTLASMRILSRLIRNSTSLQISCCPPPDLRSRKPAVFAAAGVAAVEAAEEDLAAVAGEDSAAVADEVEDLGVVAALDEEEDSARAEAAEGMVVAAAMVEEASAEAAAVDEEDSEDDKISELQSIAFRVCHENLFALLFFYLLAISTRSGVMRHLLQQFFSSTEYPAPREFLACFAVHLRN